MITWLVVASIVFTLIGALLLWFESLAYWIWLFIGWINSLFNSFQYIGADCHLILTIQTLFYVWVPVLIVLSIRNKVKLA